MTDGGNARSDVGCDSTDNCNDDDDDDGDDAHGHHGGLCLLNHFYKDLLLVSLVVCIE